MNYTTSLRLSLQLICSDGCSEPLSTVIKASYSVVHTVSSVLRLSSGDGRERRNRYFNGPGLWSAVVLMGGYRYVIPRSRLLILRASSPLQHPASNIPLVLS